MGLRGKLAEGVSDGGGVQKATTENGFKTMCHLLMKLGLKRRTVAIISMKTSPWSTERDAGLRGVLGIFINKSLVARCSASMQTTEEKPGSVWRSQSFQTLLHVKAA